MHFSAAGLAVLAPSAEGARSPSWALAIGRVALMLAIAFLTGAARVVEPTRPIAVAGPTLVYGALLRVQPGSLSSD